ncbi:MAG: hypothetical protein ACPGJV_09735 [Bacteriovoracaceae bacterium]
MELAVDRFELSLKKKWVIRFAALTSLILCTISLKEFGEPRPYYLSIAAGFINSLFLNASIIFCAFKIPRGKLRYLMALGVFLSGLGVFIIIAYGWTVATIALVFHLWLVYELLSQKSFK